jgi:hypothetical protein
MDEVAHGWACGPCVGNIVLDFCSISRFHMHFMPLPHLILSCLPISISLRPSLSLSAWFEPKKGRAYCTSVGLVRIRRLPQGVHCSIRRMGEEGWGVSDPIEDFWTAVMLTSQRMFFLGQQVLSYRDDESRVPTVVLRSHNLHVKSSLKYCFPVKCNVCLISVRWYYIYQ